ncbi:MAG: nicotinate-nucleotide--dimethylbenzimidazole phosphoribosyltransferase [Dehalococcoidia bacterium]
MTGTDRPRLAERLIVIAAADHGVARHGVSAYPREVTRQMVSNFLAGGAAINVLAHHAGARVRIVDAGVDGETPDDEALYRLRLDPGTNGITIGPAMSHAVAERAVGEGIALLAQERSFRGASIVACGDMGIGNTTAAAAIIAAVTGGAARTVTARGTGVDDDRFEAKVRAVQRALDVNQADPDDGISLLAKVGGFEIGCPRWCLPRRRRRTHSRRHRRRDLRGRGADRGGNRARAAHLPGRRSSFYGAGAHCDA